ncbi:MAG: GNAT family N-acetyltransferase [Dehalococcoidia bacterium]
MTDAVDLAQLRRLEPDIETLLGYAGQVEVIHRGPFYALLSRDTDWANFAVPEDPRAGATDTAGAVGDLRRLFAQHGRSLRFVFKQPLYPALAPLLEQEGLRLKQRQPLMICTPTSFRPLDNPDVSVRFLQVSDSDAALAAFQTIWSESLDDGSWRPTPEALSDFRAELTRGGNRSTALARHDGTPVGTGFIAYSKESFVLMRIATDPPARRMGAGAAMTTFLTREGFARGRTIGWLSAEDTRAQALYEKLGFSHAGDELSYEEAAEDGFSVASSGFREATNEEGTPANPELGDLVCSPFLSRLLPLPF